jgi:hypothetical protein
MFLNHRHYHRCPLSGQSAAVLVYDRRRINCQLVEMSLGGFGILVPQSFQAAMQSLARLQVNGLDYIVRLCRQEPRGDLLLIGLEQVEEVVSGNPATPPVSQFSHGLSLLAWLIALGSIATALYFLSAWHAA